MDSVVSLDQAVTLLGAFPALAGLDLEVSQGEVVLLQGPNGAGKTTLLRLCAGLLRLEAGSGTVLGVDLRTDRQNLSRRVGLVGHATMLYDDLSVAENVRFWSRAAGAGDGAVDAAMDRLGLEPRIQSMPVRRLSAGQRRRTAIAAMVVRRPELWLLDEPHAGLDQAARDVVDELILQAVGAGATVLVASHELDRVRAVTSRIITVAGGMVYSDHPIATQGSVGDG